MALVCDEAHCISDWGHDFRPDYLRLRRIIDELPAWTPVLATTATANQRVTDDVAAQLGDDTLVQRTSLDRASLHLSVVELADDAERLAWLAEKLPDLDGSGIIYCLTVDQAERTAAWLQRRGMQVEAYTGSTDPTEREGLEDRLRTNDLKALVATSALGMGFDKGDMAFCVHLGLPPTPVAYYQQIGRAGRAIDHAEVIAVPRPVEDAAVWNWFEKVSLPPESTCQEVLTQLSTASATSINRLEAEVNLGRTRLMTLLKILEVDEAIAKVAGGWVITDPAWRYDHDKADRLRALRREESDQMLAYAGLDECRLRFVRESLDDAEAADCGRCDRCLGSEPPVAPPSELVEEARRHLSGADVEVEPRKQWPSGLDEPKGRIKPDRQARRGRALSRLGDGALGAQVDALLDGSSRELSPAILRGLIDVLRRWDWEQRPTWVCPMPSRSNQQLIDVVADTISKSGKMPVVLATRSGRRRRGSAGRSVEQRSSGRQRVGPARGRSCGRPSRRTGAVDRRPDPVGLDHDHRRRAPRRGRRRLGAPLGPALPLVVRRSGHQFGGPEDHREPRAPDDDRRELIEGPGPPIDADGPGLGVTLNLMERLFHVAADGTRTVGAESSELGGRRRDGWVWLDVLDPTDDDISRLCREFSLDRQTRDDLGDEAQHPKVDDLETYVVLVTHGLATDDRELRTVEVDFVLGPDWLITVHDEPLPSIDHVFERVGHARFAADGPDHLLARIVEFSGERFLPLIDALDLRILDLEDHAIDGDPTILSDVQLLRREVATLRRVIGPQTSALLVASRLEELGSRARQRAVRRTRPSQPPDREPRFGSRPAGDRARHVPRLCGRADERDDAGLDRLLRDRPAAVADRRDLRHELRQHARTRPTRGLLRRPRGHGSPGGVVVVVLRPSRLHRPTEDGHDHPRHHTGRTWPGVHGDGARTGHRVGRAHPVRVRRRRLSRSTTRETGPVLVTLTFDNGPHPEATPQVLDVLADRDVKATFFVVGEQLMTDGGRGLAERAHGEGHWIGNHTMTHSTPLGVDTTAAFAEAEIERTQEVIGDLAHHDRFFRPFGEGGHITTQLLSRAAVDLLDARRLHLRALELGAPRLGAPLRLGRDGVPRCRPPGAHGGRPARPPHGCDGPPRPLHRRDP